MANTRLFDSWQIGMDLPAPFDRAIDGGVRYSTKEEDCSCYNKATRGKKATLFPVVLRAVLNLMRGGLNDGNIAAFYCMEYTKAYQGKEMDCVIIYNPKNGRFKEGIIATPELFDGNEGSAHGSSSAGSCRAEHRGEIGRTSGLCQHRGIRSAF